jgi:hypothetical protein
MGTTGLRKEASREGQTAVSPSAKREKDPPKPLTAITRLLSRKTAARKPTRYSGQIVAGPGLR